MTKTNMYRYLGRNGIITSPVLLDKAECIEMFGLVADNGKVLYNGTKFVKTALCFADELENWVEIDDPDQV